MHRPATSYKSTERTIMNFFIIFCIVAFVSIVGGFLGISWLWHPKDSKAASKPFNRTIQRPVPRRLTANRTPIAHG